jgi:3-deoxy-D-manno-octulosonic acid kinase
VIDASNDATACIRMLSCGAVLCAAQDAALIDARWFDRRYWEERGARRHSSTGRSPVLILDHGADTWVLRHYHRGGAVARFIDDHYVYTGLERTRAFREWRLLRRMSDWGLPVPAPIAARVERSGLVYRADIITRFLPATETLSAALRHEVASDAWQHIGRMLRRFHERGVDHPDLTAHNILLDDRGGVFLVDFDNAKLRPPGPWAAKGLARFERSLRKVALETGSRFSDRGWLVLRESYAASGSHTDR